MTEQDLKNNEIIDELVSKRFSLDKKGLNLFRDVLHNKRIDYIDNQFHSLLDESFRYTIPVENQLRESFDDGWVMFKNLFRFFLDENTVTYEDYIKNKFIVEKNEVKLFKYIKKYYLDSPEIIRNNFCDRCFAVLDNINYSEKENFEISFKRASEKIGTMKVPDRSMKLVLSFNFADWFLASTHEDWSSCLNLNSDHETCYWSGLPGLITDKNRMLIYLTDGRTKNYREITVDRLISRTWGLLNHMGTVFPVRHYPSKLINDDVFAAAFPFRVDCKSLDRNGYVFERGKHPLTDIITNYRGEGIYIYQDGTGFDTEYGEVELVSGYSAYHRLVPNGRKWTVDEDTLYDYSDGLDGLISEGTDLENCAESSSHCYNCGDRLRQDDEYFGDDDQVYCSDCFNESFTCCSTCGETINNEDAHFVDNEAYCDRHFHRDFVTCHECDEPVRREYVIEHRDRYYCESCFNDIYIECQKCEKIVKRDGRNHHIADGLDLCTTCFNDIYIECVECEEAVKKEEVCVHLEKDLCLKCYEEIVQPKLFEEGAA